MLGYLDVLIVIGEEKSRVVGTNWGKRSAPVVLLYNFPRVDSSEGKLLISSESKLGQVLLCLDLFRTRS